MDYFTDSQWDATHSYAVEPSHVVIDQELQNHEHLSPVDGSRRHSHTEHEDRAQHAHSMQQQESQPQYHEILLNEQFYSPALSVHNTPLLSPHALTPLPASVPQDFSMPPAAMPASHSTLATPHRRSSGKVSKQSPPMRWRAGSQPDEEFRLGDAALEEPMSVATIMDLAPQPQEDLDERLRSAIAATSASSRAPSRRTSSVSSSTRVTPRIRPRLGSSADPSPLLAPNNPPIGSAASAVSPPTGEDEVDQVFLKSNYRNLMDGTHKHLGFTAAERMTTELRAKKTVHKLAEQERRNRMNVAIAELSSVMGGREDQGGSSKAATVERATLHIQQLQVRIRELEQQVAKITGVSANGSTASADAPSLSPRQ